MIHNIFTSQNNKSNWKYFYLKWYVHHQLSFTLINKKKNSAYLIKSFKNKEYV